MTTRNKTFPITLVLCLLAGLLFMYVTSCTHDDAVLPASYSGSGTNDPTYYVTHGSDVIKFDSVAATGVYILDKAHSNVMWSTRYVGAGSLLTGRFNWFGISAFNFDEAHPANTNFTAWVQLNQVNTGEPARDGGCLLTAFSTTATADIPTNGIPKNAFNMALIKSKSVTYNATENIYNVVCDFTFMGITKEISAKLGYAGKGTYTNGTSLLRSFDLRFSFTLTDFPLKADQDQVDDAISITANVNLKQ